MKKIIMDLCSGSGAWSEPYVKAGYNVYRFTMPERDIRLIQHLDHPIHGILAAPPCRVFANSGARWYRSQADLLEGLSVMDACLRFVAIYKPQWWALENPTGKMRTYLGPPQFIFDPWEFGDAYTKKTLLWGSFTPPMSSVMAMPLRQNPIHRMSPSAERAAKRAVTPSGFAQAFFEANP